MKPTKNKVFCKNCERTKMLFETEKKAENFIKFNKAEIENESGYGPQRSYFCVFCGGWHLTSMIDKFGATKKEKLLEQHLLEKEKKSVTEIKNQQETAITKESVIINQEKRNKIIDELESEIKEMDNSQKESFFIANINVLNNEIKQLVNYESITEKEKLKDLRQRLEINYIIRKQNGFQKSSSFDKKLEEAREKEIEEWRFWLEKNGKYHNS